MILLENLPHSHGENSKSKQFNLRTLTIWASQDYFYLQPNYKKCLIPTLLQINRLTCEIEEKKIEETKIPKNIVPYYFSFFIGIMNLEEKGKQQKKVLILAQDVQLVCTINERDIFRITKPIYLFYKPSQKAKLAPHEIKLLVNLVGIFEQGMYFSFSYNLSEPLHSTRMRDKKDVSSVFNWGIFLQKELNKFDHMWNLPIIQGFVNKIQAHINAHKLKIFLISRRSLKRGGPLKCTVGLDQSGNSANYVETQLILSINDLLFSFMQVRGSAPLFWQQNYSYGMTSSITIKKSMEQNFTSLKSHFHQIIESQSYKRLNLLNLLSSHSIEAKLIQNYQFLVKKLEVKDDLTYCYYDMHKLCEQKSYIPFVKFINSAYNQVIQSCGFTAIQLTQKNNYETIVKQKQIIRTNCLSCIDRTNIAQSYIAALQIVNILNNLKIQIKDFNETLNFINNDEPFAVLYRNLWADNADHLSKQYTGTQSTQSFALRQGKLSYLTYFDHGLTSLERVLRNIREDDEHKNTAISFIMGQSSSLCSKPNEKFK